MFIKFFFIVALSFFNSFVLSADENKTEAITRAAHILMPAYNAEAFIASAVDSVMTQNYPEIKLLVFFDGPTDKTMDVVSNLLQNNPELGKKIDLTISQKNLGVAHARNVLFSHSKALNPNAYIFWLDADDQFTDTTFVQKVIQQMEKTKAQICLYNFSVVYEDDSQKLNATGLLKDKQAYAEVLDAIYSLPEQAINPLQMDSPLSITSLGWVKCYSPEVVLPEPENYPFEDFVYMAALLDVHTITALESSYEPIQYLRRSTSICGQRKAENFLIHIPAQLNRFFDAVIKQQSATNLEREKKLGAAREFVRRKLSQYKAVLLNILDAKTHPTINDSVLEEYLKKESELLAKISHDS